MKVKKNTLYLIGIVLLVVVMAYFVMSRSASSENLATEEISGEPQKVVLGMRNYNYYPEVVEVNANQPVEIYLDESVKGCLRSFTIKEFGVNEYLKTPEDKVSFTPKKKGTYSFSCSMGMAYGRIVVK